MDDFYAECDEHLVEIRRALLQLEQQLGESTLEPPTLEKIYRSLHSVKGICGMAGLQSAEQLAHTAEDYLRALTRKESVLTPSGLNVLSAVTQKLEELVLNHRHGQPTGDVKALLGQTVALLPRPNAKPTKPEGKPAVFEVSPEVLIQINNATQQGKKILRCVFRPSPELDRRGVNVSAVRVQLQSLGEILYGAPKVHKGGELRFEFLIATQREHVETAEWQADGIIVSPWEENLPVCEPITPAIPQNVAASSNPFVAPSHYVRVDLGRLDELMRMMGEIVVHQARLEEGLGRVSAVLPAGDGRTLQETRHGLSRELRHLRDGIMGLRLVPIGEIFDRLPFVVRDISRELGKKVRLVVHGEETELDKYLVERMKDPLLHLVRNAVAHGIEDPAERLALGKPAEGTITIQAATVAETVVIEVIDDGRGIDHQKIAVAARNESLPFSANPSDREVLDLLCTPGFSTRETADLGSGRGMGMAAVKNTISDLAGEMELEAVPNGGSTFRMRLPLTLAVVDALIISVGTQRFAMPHSVVQEITTAETTAINRFEQNEVIRHRNGVLPLIRLSSVFGLTVEARAARPVLVIGTGLNAVGIVADRVLGHREIVVRPIKDPLLKVSGISGATELGDGRPVLILDSASLTQKAKQGQNRARNPFVQPASAL
jgi:two-component system, chemotaxis family, sensor kinase CheA